MMMDISESAAKIQRVTLIGMGADLALGIIKILVGMLSFSQALIADGLHSLSDAITDIFVIFMARIARAAPDDKHSYGHERFETLGTVILGVALLFMAVLLGYKNLEALIAAEHHPVPSWPAILVAVPSIIAKEWVFRYTRKHATALHSNLLIANAWHSRADAISSVIVLVSLVCSVAGFGWADRVAAIIIAVIIAKIGYNFVREAVDELVDTGLEHDQLETIRQHTLQVPGVRHIRDLRSRKMGTMASIDLLIMVDPEITVSAAHQISEGVRHRVLANCHFVGSVRCGVDPDGQYEHEP